MSESTDGQLLTVLMSLQGLLQGGMGVQSTLGGFSTGFFPTPTQMQLRHEELSRTTYMREAMAQDDQRARRATIWIGDRLTGGKGSQFLRDNPMFTDVFSRLADSPMMAGFMGGRSADLAHGISSAVGVSGMRLSGNRLFGAGAASNAVAIELNRQVQEDFFKGGVARLHRTHGFDRTEMGALIKTMGDQGAFAGFDAGTLKDLEDGSHTVVINDGSKKAITDKISETARSLRNLRDIVGDKSVTELMNIGQQLTGVQVGSLGGSKLLNHRLNSLGAMADASGLDPRRVLEMQGSLVNGYANMGLGKTEAATAAYMTTIRAGARMVAGREVGQDLGSSYVTSLEDTASHAIRQTQAAFREGGEHDALTAISFAREKLKGDSSAQASASKLEAIMRMKGGPERDMALAAAMQEGGWARRFAQWGGKEAVHRNLSAEAQEGIANKLSDTLDSDYEIGARRTAAYATMEDSSLGRMSFDAREKLLQALGGTDDWLAAAKGGEGLSEAQQAALNQANNTFGKDLVSRFLNQSASLSQSTGLIVQTQTQKEQQAKRELSSFAVRAFDKDGPAPGMIDAFTQGLLGETPNSNQLAAQYVLSHGGATQLDGMTKAQAEAMLGARGKSLDDLGGQAFGKDGKLTTAGMKRFIEATGMTAFTAEAGNNRAMLDTALNGHKDDIAATVAAMNQSGWKVTAADIEEARGKGSKAEAARAKLQTAAAARDAQLGTKTMVVDDAALSTAAEQQKALMAVQDNGVIGALTKGRLRDGLSSAGGISAGDASEVLSLDTLNAMAGTGKGSLSDFVANGKDDVKATVNSWMSWVSKNHSGVDAAQARDQAIKNLSDAEASAGENTPTGKRLREARQALEKNSAGGMGEFIGRLHVVGDKQVINLHSLTGQASTQVMK